MTDGGTPAALLLEGAAAGHAGFALEVPRLVLRAGEAVALHGPSGAGKSTLLEMLALARAPLRAARFALRPGGGAAALDLAALWREGADGALTDARARHMGLVPQRGGLLPYLDLRANIGLGREVLGLPDDGAVERLAEALGIAQLLRRKPATLSVGERQRAAIARALAHAPRIVLADEPTASLHPAMADVALGLLRAAAHGAGAALLLATHDPERARAQGFRLAAIRPDPAGGRSVLDEVG